MMDVNLIARSLSGNGAGRSSAKAFGDRREVEGWVDGGGDCFDLCCKRGIQVMRNDRNKE